LELSLAEMRKKMNDLNLAALIAGNGTPSKADE
jgi:hypothetical protein